MGTFKADPPFWCFVLWCGPCSSYVLTKRALYAGTSAALVICLAVVSGESRFPEFCLVTELSKIVSCCFGNSVSSTRFLLQDEFNIRTTKYDNCINAFMIVLSQLAYLCRILACLTGDEELAEAAHILTCISDMVYYSDGKFGPSPMTIPPVQQMSRLDQPYGPTVGYPPAFGTPYAAPGFPPPSASTYPPGDYPPQQPPSFWR
ncbi:unnamed protein product [Withania somnifera]